MNLKDPTHPIWELTHFAFLAFVLFIFATNFDATEFRTLLLVAGELGLINYLKKRKAKEDAPPNDEDMHDPAMGDS